MWAEGIDISVCVPTPVKRPRGGAEPIPYEIRSDKDLCVVYESVAFHALYCRHGRIGRSAERSL